MINSRNYDIKAIVFAISTMYFLILRESYNRCKHKKHVFDIIYVYTKNVVTIIARI